MKTLLSSNHRNGLLAAVTCATILAGILFHAQIILAMPRPPMPPVPSSGSLAREF
jgi:hypothetical protein